MPAFALRSAREYWLMPLVTSTSGFGGGRHHRPARTHAKTIDATPIRCSDAPACNRPPPAPDCPHRAPPARRIDHSLRMLDSYTDGKRLLVQMYARFRQAPRNRSRAEWPGASTTCRDAISLPSANRTPGHSAGPRPQQQPLHPRTKSIFPAQRLDRLREGDSTTETSRNVPICGFAAIKISAGAPARTNSSSTRLPRCAGSRMPDHSLPSEKRARPALAELYIALRTKAPICATARTYHACVRARSCRVPAGSGRNPICASVNAANSPHGPAPITIGLRKPAKKAPAPRGGRSCPARGRHAPNPRAAPARPLRRPPPHPAYRSARSAPRLRASTPRRKTCSVRRSHVGEAQARDRRIAQGARRR